MDVLLGLGVRRIDNIYHYANIINESIVSSNKDNCYLCLHGNPLSIWVMKGSIWVMMANVNSHPQKVARLPMDLPAFPRFTHTYGKGGMHHNEGMELVLRQVVLFADWLEILWLKCGKNQHGVCGAL